jgi:hypothetical protein
MVATKEKPKVGHGKSLASKRLRRPPQDPSLLPMGKRPWNHADFIKTLDELSRAAGIPDSNRGTPNTTVFEEYTDVSPTQVGRWRSGTHQPTTDSLRMVAYALAPRAGLDPAKTLATLEIKAGRRSEAEARASAPAQPREVDVDLIISRIEIRLDQNPPAEERRDLERRLVRARRARDAQRVADELMAEIHDDERRRA